MLAATDSWGRTLISHGILSGNPQVFEVAIEAVRADVLDEEVRTRPREKENRSVVRQYAGAGGVSSCQFPRGSMRASRKCDHDSRSEQTRVSSLRFGSQA